jgi:hypothetical protein
MVQGNQLALNFDKTCYIYFVTKQSISDNLNISYNNNLITTTSCTKFLAMATNEALSWDKNIETLARKLSTACYLIRSAKTYTSTSLLKTIYYAFFTHWWPMESYFGETPHTALQFFAYRKRAVQIMKGCGIRVLCRDLFQKLHILPPISQYLLSLLMFVVQHKDLFKHWKSQPRK